MGTDKKQIGLRAAAAAAEDGQFVRGLRNEQVRMRRKEAKGRKDTTRGWGDRLCRCVFVGNENSAFVAPLSFSSLPHFVPSDIVCRICLPFAPESERRLPHVYALRLSGGNPAETKVKQEEHHGRRAERARGDQPDRAERPFGAEAGEVGERPQKANFCDSAAAAPRWGKWGYSCHGNRLNFT